LLADFLGRDPHISIQAIPPAEAEHRYYAKLEATPIAA